MPASVCFWSVARLPSFAASAVGRFRQRRNGELMFDRVTPSRIGIVKGTSVWASWPFVPSAAWLVSIFSCGTVLSVILQRYLLEPTQTAQHIVEFHVGETFGVAASLSLVLANPRRSVSLTRADVAILMLSALMWFVPEQHGIYLATTLAGIWFCLARRSDRQLVSLGQIWLALSIYELWGKLLFKLCYQMIEIVELSLIYRIGRFFYDGLRVDGPSLHVRGDWSVVLLEGCSSFHNLSLTVLVWLSILKIANRLCDVAAFRALGVSAGLVIAINIARILAMLPSREAFLFWHDGAGSSLVALASVAAAIVPILLHVERRACELNRQN